MQKGIQSAQQPNFKKYKFRKHDGSYSKLFKIEKFRLLKILSGNPIIEHVGSTAIPGLGGKGMVDIAIAVPKNKILAYKQKLEANGYVYKKKPRDNERKYLERRIIYKSNERRVHIHLTYSDSSIFRFNFILFRDYLRNNPKIAKEYEQVKKKALKYSKGNGKLYLAYKQPFIDKIIKIAKKNRK
jgi:GrpB-like predicted nucleotidyltransferase (UPF0157 family)